MFKKILITILLMLFALFFLLDAQVVEVRFLFWKTEASRALVLLITFAGGLITGGGLDSSLCNEVNNDSGH